MSEHLDDLRETNLRFRNVKTVENLINLAKETNVIFYDFRFTDIKGTWHHISYYVDAIDEDSFKNVFLLMVVLFLLGSLSINQI